LVIWTLVLGQIVNAFTGAASHSRQEVQWQYPMMTGCPVTTTSTAPQKQLPEWLVCSLICLAP
jgi:hypothetical protein